MPECYICEIKVDIREATIDAPHHPLKFPCRTYAHQRCLEKEGWVTKDEGGGSLLEQTKTKEEGEGTLIVECPSCGEEIQYPHAKWESYGSRDLD